MSIAILFCTGRIIWTIVHFPTTHLHHVTPGQQQSTRRCWQILASPTVGHLTVLIFLLIFQVKLSSMSLFSYEQNRRYFRYF